MRSFAALMAMAFCASLVSAAEPIPAANRINGVAIGCQAYSFRLFTLFEAIENTAKAGGKVIELREVGNRRQLLPGTWHRNGAELVACFGLSKGESRLEVA